MKYLRGILKTLFFLFWTFFSVLAGQFLAFFLSKLIFGPDFINSPTLETVYTFICYSFSIILAIFLPYWLKKKKQPPQKTTLKPTRNSLGLSGLPTFSDILLAPIAFIVVLGVSNFLTVLFSNFPWFDVNEAQDVGYNLIYSSWDRFIAFISLVIIAPISEELIFRGYLYGHLRRLIKSNFSVPLSILLVSLLFALLHGQWNVAVVVFCLSVGACVLREITGTIYSGIILHILKNAVAFYFIYVMNMI